MAVAAYAAVLSLIDVLDQIQHPSKDRLHLDRKQIKTLQDKVSFLPDFLELYCSQGISDEIQDLAWQISDVVNEAEVIIDSHVVDQICMKFQDDSGALSLFCKNIERVIETIDSIKGKLMTFKEVMAVEKQQLGVSLPAASTAPPSTASGKNNIVGFEERLFRIMEELTGYTYDLQILPIVGMGGIGKTTLARNAFDDPHSELHFDIRIWLTVSQEYSTHGILRGLLDEPGDRKTKEADESLAKLGSRLHERLFDRRYLVVLDDIWNTKIWNDIKSFFPDNKNGSRIMVTTRLSDVAVSLGSQNPYIMDLLDEDQSWHLLRKKAFAQDGCCPPELKKIGKNIAKRCKGLPLAIVVIGGLLSNSNMTRQYWEFIAENVNSFANSANEEHCLNILSLSYNHLPMHLKPCFLYMRVFPEDEQIQVSKLIKLWVAHGFLKPVMGKTLEIVAKEYFKDLLDRNLIFISGKTLFGKIKTCGIHDLLRDLCFKESQKEYFHCDPKVQIQKMHYFHNMKNCFLCGTCPSTNIYRAQIHGTFQALSFFACSLCNACRVVVPQLDRLRVVSAVHMSHWRMTRITETAIHGSGHVYCGELLFPAALRYYQHLSIMGGREFKPTALPLLWNLQTLILNPGQHIVLPSEIWHMPQLRHLKIYGAILCDPPDRKGSITILENLHTLSFIRKFKCSHEILERIPNLKKLGIIFDGVDVEDMEWSYHSLHNLVHLCGLESLSVQFSQLILKEMSVPHSLKKLELLGCNIAREEMTIIGSLPNLEALRLNKVGFEESEWNPVEGEFLRLKLLLLRNIHLKYWGAEKIHFPSLETLALEGLSDLVNIPSEIGDIETLCLIQLISCNESIVNSAREILNEQQDLGNEILQLEVLFSRPKYDADAWKPPDL